MGSHRNLGNHHVSILDDHDHVFGDKVRFSAGAASDHQVVAGTALQLFTLGIPCIYYGTEQAFAGPESSEWPWLPCFRSCKTQSDAYLREAMFGPVSPRKAGRDGLNGATDPDLPGFGPFGTAGRHCFDRKFPTFRRIQALIAIRQAFPALPVGRQYLRQTSVHGSEFYAHNGGEIVAWSRILDNEELLCVLNTHGRERCSARIIVDADLNRGRNVELQVVANTEQAALEDPRTYSGNHPVGSRLQVQPVGDGGVFVSVASVGPSEVLVLANHP